MASVGTAMAGRNLSVFETGAAGRRRRGIGPWGVIGKPSPHLVPP